MPSLIPILIIIILAILLFISSIRIMPQANAYVIERLGAYNGTWQVGPYESTAYRQNSEDGIIKRTCVGF